MQSPRWVSERETDHYDELCVQRQVDHGRRGPKAESKVKGRDGMSLNLDRNVVVGRT